MSLTCNSRMWSLLYISQEKGYQRVRCSMISDSNDKYQHSWDSHANGFRLVACDAHLSAVRIFPHDDKVIFLFQDVCCTYLALSGLSIVSLAQLYSMLVIRLGAGNKTKVVRTQRVPFETVRTLRVQFETIKIHVRNCFIGITNYNYFYYNTYITLVISSYYYVYCVC